MMPQTVNGMGPFECISALQKCIRRGEEERAMHFAMEMCMSSKSYFTMTVNRLFVIAHEDIGLADPDAVQFAVVNILAMRDMWDKEKPGRYGIALGNVIRRLCRAHKSREGDWFLILAAWKVRDSERPVVEDWMKDMHTPAGKKLGRGLEHFLTEGCKLWPVVPRPEPYEERAIEVMRRVHAAKAEKRNPSLFPEGEKENES